MSDYLNKHLTLVLNALYQPIGSLSIKKACVALCSENNGVSAAKALDLEYDLNEDGTVNFMSPNKFVPTDWESWINLELRDYDIPIRTAHRVIRAPIVILAHNFRKMVYRKLRPNKRNLYNIYGGKCIWTGRILSFNESSIEHMVCRSANGDSSWQNLGISDKKLNSERGNLTLDKWKYKQQYPLKEPKSTPISGLINEPKRPEWQYFLIR